MSNLSNLRLILSFPDFQKLLNYMLTALCIETLWHLRIFFGQIFTLLPVVQVLGGFLLHTVIVKRWSLPRSIKRADGYTISPCIDFFDVKSVTVEMSQPQMKISRCSLFQHMSYWLCTSSTDSAFSSKICFCWIKAETVLGVDLCFWPSECIVGSVSDVS